MQHCEAKVAAVWLWANTNDVKSAREVVDVDPPNPKRKREDDGAVADTTAQGKAICKLWNCGKRNAGQCKNGRAHVCNYLANGKPCGKPHRRCEAHK